MNVLLITVGLDEQLAHAANAIATGIEVAGGQITRSSDSDNPLPEPFDRVFIGFDVKIVGLPKPVEKLVTRGNWMGKSVVFFCTHTQYGKKALNQASAVFEKAGAHPAGTINLKLRGGLKRFLGQGALDETELARAQAFGERTTRMATGVRANPGSEKNKIPGYRK